MQEQRTRRPSRSPGYARCFVSRRRVTHKRDYSFRITGCLAQSALLLPCMGPDARGEGPGRKDRETKRGCDKLGVSLSHPRVDICPGIVRPRPYVCSLSGAPNSLVAGDEIGNKRKPLPPFTPVHGNIWQRGSMNRADSLAVSIADFVPRKSIAFAVTPAKNRELLKSSAIRRIRRGKCGNARARREEVEGKERKSKKRFVGSQRGRALGTTKSRRSRARSRHFFFLFSSNLTPSSLCRRQMPDSIEEIPKEGLQTGKRQGLTTQIESGWKRESPTIIRSATTLRVFVLRFSALFATVSNEHYIFQITSVAQF